MELALQRQVGPTAAFAPPKTVYSCAHDRQRARATCCPPPGHASRALNRAATLALRQLEAAVVELPFLHTAASAAYQAYMRSYATHSKAVQRVLHIGQVPPAIRTLLRASLPFALSR
eukprot:12097-Prymnesium_polylepis.1